MDIQWFLHVLGPTNLSHTYWKSSQVIWSHHLSAYDLLFWAIRGWGGQLAQWDKRKVTVKPFFIHLTTKVKQEAKKTPGPQCSTPFPTMDSTRQRLQHKDHLIPRRPKQMGPWAGEKRGKELGVERYWVKVEKVPQPMTPDREVLAYCEVPQPRSLIMKFQMKTHGLEVHICISACLA